jgi:nitroimidazol reductase NimA-like FMN-containing flavoprotein (pyridoxamine 5'-phosphate oxidase superfamily)
MTNNADTKFKREAARGSHDFNLTCEILDAGKVCHVGFTLDEQPYVLPMAYARMGKQLLIHGSVASRLMKNLAAGLRCCVTVTHFDGLVYARSTFNSSMNYRSAMVFGTARLITDLDEKRKGIQPPRRSEDVHQQGIECHQPAVATH